MDAGAAAASATSSRLTCNIGFFTTPGGWFKLAEVFMGLLVWAMLASRAYWAFPALQFVMFVTVTSWVLTLILMIVYMLALHATILSGAPWDVIEFGFNMFWGLMYFIAACVEAAWNQNISVLVASTVFAFFVTITYVLHTLFAYKTWRGAWPFQPATNGNNVNT